MKKISSFITVLAAVSAIATANASPSQCIQSDLEGEWAVSSGGQIIKMKISAGGTASTTAVNSFTSEPYESTTATPLTLVASSANSCEFTGSFTVDYAKQSYDKSKFAYLESNASLPVTGVLSADKMTMVISNAATGIYPENSDCNSENYYCYTTGFDFSGTAVKVQ